MGARESFPVVFVCGWGLFDFDFVVLCRYHSLEGVGAGSLLREAAQLLFGGVGVWRVVEQSPGLGRRGVSLINGCGPVG